MLPVPRSMYGPLAHPPILWHHCRVFRRFGNLERPIDYGFPAGHEEISLVLFSDGDRYGQVRSLHSTSRDFV